MANTLYNRFRVALGSAEINWISDTIKAIAVDTAAYTFSATHQYLSSIPAGARVATATLTGKGIDADGSHYADNTSFPNLTGASTEAVVLYKDTGVEGTSILAVYIDTATGLPFVPNGNTATLIWAAASPRIFRP